MIEPATSTTRRAIGSLSAHRDRDTGPVAVIVVNFNAGEHLRSCLRAIGGQTVRPRRVIVIDNGSTDDSLSGAAPRMPPCRDHRGGKESRFRRGK